MDIDRIEALERRLAALEAQLSPRTHDEPRYAGLAEVAERVGLAVATVRKIVADKLRPVAQRRYDASTHERIPAMERHGRSWRIYGPTLSRFLVERDRRFNEDSMTLRRRASRSERAAVREGAAHHGLDREERTARRVPASVPNTAR